MSGATRLFTAVTSAFFTAGGVWMARSGDKFGWYIAIFFGFCFLVAVVTPWLPKPAPMVYKLVITEEEIVCEHPMRKRESIRWADVDRIWYITTSDGPFAPDEWLVLDGAKGGCSFPTEADGFKQIWDELKRRFDGFDYRPMIQGGTDDAKHLCWERRKAG